MMQMALAEEYRLLPLECGFNFRDFGGYPTMDGGHIKSGMLYRAGMMAFVDEIGRDRLASLNIASICDLRTTMERERHPTRWHEELGVELWHRDYHETNADTAALLRKGEANPDKLRQIMIDFYRDAAYEHAESLKALFSLLLAGKVPLVVNCSAGKDRTGTAAALVLSALQVDRETIIQDYLLTAKADFSYLAEKARTDDAPAMPMDVLAPLMAADIGYVKALFDGIEQRSGSVEQYLDGVLFVGPGERKRLRTLLVDG
jgi:protein-tyrosine phosphatase